MKKRSVGTRLFHVLLSIMLLMSTVPELGMVSLAAESQDAAAIETSGIAETAEGTDAAAIKTTDPANEEATAPEPAESLDDTGSAPDNIEPVGDIEKYNLWIGETQITELNKTKVPMSENEADGYATYDPENNILNFVDATLKSVHSVSDGHGSMTDYGIYLKSSSPLKLTGKLTVPEEGDAVEAAIRAYCNVEMNGDFTLCRGKYGVSLSTGGNTLTVSGGTLDIDSTSSAICIEGGTEASLILTGKVKIKNPEEGAVIKSGFLKTPETNEMVPKALIAETEDYGIWIGSTLVTEENKDRIPMDENDDTKGWAEFDAENGVLTFHNATLTSYHETTGGKAGIVFGQELKKIRGKLTIPEELGLKQALQGVSGCKTLELDGNLTLYAQKYGIYMWNPEGLTISGGKLEIHTPDSGEVGSAFYIQTNNTTDEDKVHLENVKIKSKSGGSEWKDVAFKKLDGGYAIQLVMTAYDAAIPSVVIEDSTTKYDLWVGATQVTELNKADVLGDGKVEYDPVKKELTFDDEVITEPYEGVTPSRSIYAANQHMTIKGKVSTPYGIYVAGGYDLYLDGDITAVNSNGVKGTGIGTENGDISVLGGRIEARDWDIAIMSDNGNLKMTDMTIAEPADASYNSDSDKSIYDSARTAPVKSVLIIQAYPIWVGDTQVDSGNKDNVLGDDNASVQYDPDRNTLTLTGNVKIAENYNHAAIYAQNDITIQGQDYATVTLADSSTASFIICCENGRLTTKGRLVLCGNSETEVGVYANSFTSGGELIIKGITRTNALGMATPSPSGGNITVESGAVEITSENGVAIIANGKIVVGKGYRITSPEGEAKLRDDNKTVLVGEKQAKSVTIENNSEFCLVTYLVNKDGLNVKEGTWPEPSEQLHRKWRSIDRPEKDPEAVGYKFTDWYADKACKSPYDFSKIIMTGTNIYAGWEEVKCTVTFNLNDGRDTEFDKQEVQKGQKVLVPDSPTLEGKTFAGWFADKECKTKIDLDAPVMEDTTVYAGWAFTVTFDANGHGTAPDPQNVMVGEKAVKPADLTAEGYNFLGWFADKECKTLFDFTQAIKENTTVYAGWENKGGSITPEDYEFLWNLFEDNSEHRYTVGGTLSGNKIENTNAKSSKYYDATLSGNVIVVKAKEGTRKKAASAANSVLEFNLGEKGVVTYTLPVCYEKPVFKLSSNSAQIKAGSKTTLSTNILVKSFAGTFEPYIMTKNMKLSGIEGATPVAGTPTVKIVTDKAQKGKLSFQDEGWDTAIALPYSVKASAKDIIVVDMGGQKAVTLNQKILPKQVISLDVTLNGADPTGKIEIVENEKKNPGLGKLNGGKLEISLPAAGVKDGSYTISLKQKDGDAKADVKVKVVSKESGVINFKVKAKYDVVTELPMVIEPTLKAVSGTITDLEVMKPTTFKGYVSAGGTIVLYYDAKTPMDASKLDIGDVTLRIKLDGKYTVKTTISKVKAKKSTPKPKAAAIVMPTGEGVAADVNITSSCKAGPYTYFVTPDKIEIDTAKTKGVTAEVSKSDPSVITLKNLTGKSGTVKATVTYPGGVTKAVTIKVKAPKK